MVKCNLIRKKYCDFLGGYKVEGDFSTRSYFGYRLIVLVIYERVSSGGIQF